MTRTSRNLAGFVAGWLFIFALAFGMEAAHALEFKGSYASTYEFVGGSGSSLCSQLAANRSADSANYDYTVAESPTLTRNTITGSCRLTSSTYCYTDYKGNQVCGGGTTTVYAMDYQSRCSASDPWVQITASAPACECPPGQSMVNGVCMEPECVAGV